MNTTNLSFGNRIMVSRVFAVAVFATLFVRAVGHELGLLVAANVTVAPNAAGDPDTDERPANQRQQVLDHWRGRLPTVQGNI